MLFLVLVPHGLQQKVSLPPNSSAISSSNLLTNMQFWHRPLGETQVATLNCPLVLHPLSLEDWKVKSEYCAHDQNGSWVRSHQPKVVGTTNPISLRLLEPPNKSKRYKSLSVLKNSTDTLDFGTAPLNSTS